LIGYKGNILGTSNQAHRIALDLREAGRNETEPGKLKETKGLGWYVDEYNMAQVSMNLNNYKVTAIHTAYEEVKKSAKELNIAVAGSELVGLVPLEAMLMAADYYMKEEGLMIVDERQKIALVVERLGLNSISKFDSDKRIIEYMIEESNELLASLSVRDFIEEIANRSSAPGGGSASAAIAAIGAGLGCMVGQLTYGIRKFENVDKEIRSLIPPLYNAVQNLIPMIDADTNAFNDYMDAMRLPKNTDEEKQIRTNAMQEGLKKAIQIPLATMRYGDEVWDAMIEVAKYGNIASKSDVEVGASALAMGIWGAYKNVLINLKDIKDTDFINKTTETATKIKDRATEKQNEVLKILDKREK
jgi:glutamate formiminotransferase/formiminotetrahydrofolate cyclodeaminase